MQKIPSLALSSRDVTYRWLYAVKLSASIDHDPPSISHHDFLSNDMARKTKLAQCARENRRPSIFLNGTGARQREMIERYQTFSPTSRNRVHWVWTVIMPCILSSQFYHKMRPVYSHHHTQYLEHIYYQCLNAWAELASLRDKISPYDSSPGKY